MRVLYLLTFSPLCFFSFVAAEEIFLPQKDPDLYYSMIELVCREGYYIQEHKVVTEDGYILGLFRIPGGGRHRKIDKSKSHYIFVHNNYHPDFEDCVQESSKVNFSGPPVVLVHGVGAASDCWVLQGEEYDLAYILANNGYDVWLSNSRGNFYSKSHKTLPITNRTFWDYSFHEIGFYDIPATVDFILNVTGYKKLLYIGHSMGTTAFFVMASMRPEYNEKIKLFVGLTPVAHIRRQSFSRRQRALLNTVSHLTNAFYNNGIWQFVPRNNASNYLTRTFCSRASPIWLQDLCYDYSFFFVGESTKYFKREKLATYLSHGYSGGSVKTLLHYAQLLDAPSFQYFDNGPEKNLRKYGQRTPPSYDLQKITTAVALFYSRGDSIAEIEDVEHLKTLLPNVVKSDSSHRLSHLDFIWAYTARKFVYEKILQLMNEYLNQ